MRACVYSAYAKRKRACTLRGFIDSMHNMPDHHPPVVYSIHCIETSIGTVFYLGISNAFSNVHCAYLRMVYLNCAASRTYNREHARTHIAFYRIGLHMTYFFHLVFLLLSAPFVRTSKLKYNYITVKAVHQLRFVFHYISKTCNDTIECFSPSIERKRERKKSTEVFVVVVGSCRLHLFVFCRIRHREKK